MKNKLLLTFCRADEVDEKVQEILKYYFPQANYKLFILEAEAELVISFTAPNFNGEFLPGTIIAHRKKQTSTIYTINALNCLIRELNNGLLDPRYIVNWELYKHQILLVEEGQLKKIRTKLHRIISS